MYRDYDDGIAVNDDDVDYGDSSASGGNPPTLAEIARAQRTTTDRVLIQGEPSTDVTDTDDTTTYAATASQGSALQGVASELDVTVLLRRFRSILVQLLYKVGCPLRRLAPPLGPTALPNYLLLRLVTQRCPCQGGKFRDCKIRYLG